MTPGEAIEYAVAALARGDGSSGWHVIFIGRDDQAHVLNYATRREAHAVINRTVRDLLAEVWMKKRGEFVPRLGGKRTLSVRPPMSPRTRFEILSRDGYRCRYCGREAPDVKLHVDHVVPVSAGGSSDPDNLVASCQDCNLGKSTRSVA